MVKYYPVLSQRCITPYSLMMFIWFMFF
eukprot:UN08681